MPSGSPLFNVDFGYSAARPPNFLDPSAGVLPSRQTVPFMGELPTGAPSGRMDAGGSSAAGWGDALEAGLPLLLSLLGPENKDLTAARTGAADLSKMGLDLSKAGGKLSAEGQAALAPVLRYLTAVAGGDPAALFEATAPERKRVLDQYDTAKQALGFEPRGGGRASSVMELEAQKASDLATLPAEARRAGVSELGDLGGLLASLGVQTRGQGVGATSQAAQISAMLGQQTEQRQAGLGAMIGKTLAKGLPWLLALI